MGTKIGEDTFVLFPRRTFAGGLGMLMDPVGASVLYNVSRDEAEADTRATAADWHAVAEDLRSAISQYRSQLEASNTSGLVP